MDPISKNVTLHQAGKACQGQAFKPFGPFVSYYGKKLENKNLGYIKNISSLLVTLE
jgi:hypothetical protein